MILETGRNNIKGITLIEILVVIVIISMFTLFSVFYPHKAISQTNLDIACKNICEILNRARSQAMAENITIQVIFNNDTCGIYKNANLVDKPYKLPRFIVIKEKTDGFSPVEFLPEGTAKQAGYIIIEDTSTKKTKKIILYNLTGKTAIKNNQ